MSRSSQRLGGLGLGIAIGLLLGVFLGSNWPFGLSEREVADRLVEHRESRGGSRVKAACHERPGGDFYCEAWEAAGRESPGYGSYIARRRGDELVFERL